MYEYKNCITLPQLHVAALVYIEAVYIASFQAVSPYLRATKCWVGSTTMKAMYTMYYFCLQTSFAMYGNVICTGVGLGSGNETNHMLAANHNFRVKYRLGSIHKINPSVDYTHRMRS